MARGTAGAGGGGRSARSLGRVVQRLAGGLDLPPDLVYDLPRLTVVAGISLTIENHRGLVAFEPTLVSVAAGAGRIVVRGSELRIGVVRGEEITVTGQLTSIEFQR